MPDGQISRVKCARTHLTRYVASRNMWRPAGNIHWNQRSGGSGRHITAPSKASEKRHQFSVIPPVPAGFWNKVSIVVGSPFRMGEARPVSTIYLCDVRRSPHDHGKGVTR